ncbi:MAG: hypothetical protein WBN22_02160 [Verrucomicrobiia bacterium]
MPDTSQHPVWSVYDELRTARLNVLCLQNVLSSLRTSDRASEILIAVTTTTSIGSFWFLQNKAGEYIWKTVGCVAVVVSIVKPILKYGHRIQANEKLLAGYTLLHHELNCLCIEIRFLQRFDNAIYKDFLKIMDSKADLLKASSETNVSATLRKKCEQQVLQELPTELFYIPPA